MKTEVRTVCVYCASSREIDGKYSAVARQMGRLLAKSGRTVVCGAGNEGLMAALTDGALEASGAVTGVIPRFMADNGWMHTGLTRSIVVDDMHTRKRTMAGLADAAIALPGGCGTIEELLELITWKQLGLFHGKIVIVSTDGYYAPLLEQLNRAADEKFMKPSHRRLWRVALTPEEALAELDGPDNEPAEPKRT